MKYLILSTLVVLIACGSSVVYLQSQPHVEISCDIPVEKNRCYVLVHSATDVEAFYNGRLEWYDYDISNPEDRQTYVDSPPDGLFEVKACNDLNCTNKAIELPE
jgi:hypothetical protein